MFISQKIKWLLGYCSEYIDHAEQYDERQEENNKFNINLGVEEYILKYLQGKYFILLTGDAGDGKSRTLFNLRQNLDESWEIINDFSEYDLTIRENLLTQLIDALKNKTKKYIIAANSGIFINSVIQNNKHELLELMKDENICLTLNFNSRNLAMKEPSQKTEETKFYEIITKYLDSDNFVDCEGCSSYKECPFVYNIKNFIKPSVVEGVRILMDTLYLMGIHITFRDLLSSISYFITKGKTCDDIKNCSDIDEYYYFNNIFCYDGNNNRLLSELSKLDVAKKDIAEFDFNLYNKKDFSDLNVDFKCNNNPIIRLNQIKRYLFFTSPERLVKDFDNLYDFLPTKYVNEFRVLINQLEKNGYIYGMDSDTKSVVTRFELGLNKISNPDHSDAQLILFDSPPLITKDVRLEYSSKERLLMVLCTPDFYKNKDKKENNDKKTQKKNLEDINQFYCFIYYDSDNNDKIEYEKFPSIKVNYKLFEQIMLAQDNVFSVKTANIADNASIINFTKSIFQGLKADNEVSIKWIGTKENDIDNINISFIKQPGFIKALQPKMNTSAINKISISYTK